MDKKLRVSSLYCALGPGNQPWKQNKTHTEDVCVEEREKSVKRGLNLFEERERWCKMEPSCCCHSYLDAFSVFYLGFVSITTAQTLSSCLGNDIKIAWSSSRKTRTRTDDSAVHKIQTRIFIFLKFVHFFLSHLRRLKIRLKSIDARNDDSEYSNHLTKIVCRSLFFLFSSWVIY